jgi:hypothetical protein
VCDGAPGDVDTESDRTVRPEIEVVAALGYLEEDRRVDELALRSRSRDHGDMRQVSTIVRTHLDLDALELGWHLDHKSADAVTYVHRDCATLTRVRVLN